MGGGVYAHRYTHGGPPRPHLIVQCVPFMGCLALVSVAVWCGLPA
jgi:hypothetical protein